MSRKNRSTYIEGLLDRTPRSREDSRADSETESARKLVKYLQLEIPDLDKAGEIIEAREELAYKDIKFNNPSIERSVASFLTDRFYTYSKEVQEQVCEFISYINDKCPRDEAFKDVSETIKQLTERDKGRLKAYELLINLIDKTKNSESSASVTEEDLMPQFNKDEATPEQIVEHTIRNCLAHFNDEDFDFDTITDDLVQDTMNFARDISFDELTDIVKNIEDTIEDPNDEQWVSFRQTIGAIVSKTAEHYIEENARVDKNQKLLLLLCFTIIGAIVPLLYYHLKVKPTHASSPLVAYEMSKGEFEAATEKENPLLESGKDGPRATVHRANASSIYRRFTVGDQAHLTHEKNGETTLRKFVFFSTERSKNAHLFNGTLDADQFVNEGAEIRWVALKGEQADRTEEKLDGRDYEVVLGT